MTERRRTLSTVAAAVVTIVLGTTAAGCSSGSSSGLFGLANTRASRSASADATAVGGGPSGTAGSTGLQARLVRLGDLPYGYQQMPGGDFFSDDDSGSTDDSGTDDLQPEGTGPECALLQSLGSDDDGADDGPTADVAFVLAGSDLFAEQVETSTTDSVGTRAQFDALLSLFTTCGPYRLTDEGTSITLRASSLSLAPVATGDYCRGVRLSGTLKGEAISEDIAVLQSGNVGALVLVLTVGAEGPSTRNLVTLAYDRLAGKPVPTSTSTAGTI